jgi:hypothetical protein
MAGPVTDAQDTTLADLRYQIIDPLIHEVVAAGGVEAITLSWGISGHPGDVWLRVDLLDAPSFRQPLVQATTREEAVSEVRSKNLADFLRAQLRWWLETTAPS